MSARFASWGRRYPDGWDAQTAGRVRARAHALEADVCARLAIGSGDVSRLPWTAETWRTLGGRRAAA